MPKDYDLRFDWSIAGLFIFALAIIIWLLAVGLAIFELPTELALKGSRLYIVIPFEMLRLMFDFVSQRVLRFTLFVPVVSCSIEVIFFMLSDDPMA